MSKPIVTIFRNSILVHANWPFGEDIVIVQEWQEGVEPNRVFLGMYVDQVDDLIAQLLKAKQEVMRLKDEYEYVQLQEKLID